MEVWEEAIKKAVEKKEAGSTETAKVDTLVPGQLRSPTKEEASATKQQASQSAEAGAEAVAKEGVAEVRPFESKTAQFTAFARSSAETRPGEKDDLAPASDAPKAAVWMPPGTPVVTPTEAQTAPAETKAAPAETKAAPFAAFATAHAAARELCKGKQGECLSQSA